jgi:hypothetical protein
MNTIDMRLQEATALLDTLYDQVAVLHADLWHWEQEKETAEAFARRRDLEELQYWFNREHYTKLMLQRWMWKLSEEARAALDQRKRWSHRLLTFLACWFSAGLFLIVEIQTIRALQSKRDFPPFGEQQRLWSRMIEEARRNINFLRALQAPRPTPRLKECNQEVSSLRRRLDALGSQIQIQQTRIQVLQQQRAQYP